MANATQMSVQEALFTNKQHLSIPTGYADCAATYRVTLTTVAWWLEAVLCEGTPPHREDVPRVILAPVIKCTPPPIEHDKDLSALHFSDGGRADEVWVLLVHSLQLHAWLEAVLGGALRFLKRVQYFN